MKCANNRSIDNWRFGWKTINMKDVFEQSSHRPNDQLLGATSNVPNGHKESEEVKDDGLGASSSDSSDAEGMVHYLMVQSKKPAIMVDTAWTEVGRTHIFAKEQCYIDATRNSPCVVHQMTCPDQGGIRHLLFLGKSADLTEAAYLECLPSSLPHLC